MTQLIMWAVRSRSWPRVTGRACLGRTCCCQRPPCRAATGGSGGYNGNRLSKSSSSRGITARRTAGGGEWEADRTGGAMTANGSHIRTGGSSPVGSSSEDSLEWLPVAVFTGGVGSGGSVLPSRRRRRDAMAANSSAGASWTPWIVSARRRATTMMRSVAVMCGTGIAWCWKRNVSVTRSAPVSFIMTRMQR